MVKIPVAKVTEKPFIGPDPMKNRIIAAINVVMFASKIVVLDFIYPLSKAIILFFMGSGPIKGFSVTLATGILTTLFTVYFVARLLTAIYVTKNKDKEKLI